MRQLLLLLLLCCGVVVCAERPLATTPRLQAALNDLSQVLSHPDPAPLRTALAGFTQAWTADEEAIRRQDQQAYLAIEEAMGDLDYHLQADSLDLASARTAAARLHSLLTGAAPAPVAATGPTSATIPALLTQLQQVQAQLAAGDAAAAKATLATAHQGWLAVEGQVKTRDAGAYAAIEDALLRGTAELKAGQSAAASASLALVEARLSPFRVASAYGMGDVVVILLREGLEALFIISALLAFLSRSGQAEKRRVIWAGAGIGLVASVAFALVINLVFKAAFSDANREVVEGLVGLVAAGMLFWVSWWLHRAANLARWNAYIAGRTQAAIATGSVLTLGLLSFLAVIREGAETALFYLGMAPSIATGDFLLGLAVGSLALAVAGVALIKLGARLPLRPFFAVMGLLILAMGIKFIGAGIHALQIAGWLAASPIPGLPTLTLLGFYPTWETALAQLAVLGVIALVAWVSSRPAPRLPSTTSSPTANPSPTA